MTRSREARRFVSALGLAAAMTAALGAEPAARDRLPARLDDREFWRLIAETSEPDGYFRSDNLTSNELLFQRVVPDLVARVKPGEVYLGVGPEQNFTYIAAVRPALAIILDIRRGNLLVQLMYKAIFELSADRADFVSMLFSRRRPPGLGRDASAADLFAAFERVPADPARYRSNVDAIRARLVGVHGLPLTPKDLVGIEAAYHAFFSRGYAIRYAPTYADLMTATDDEGVSRSYLATEEHFAVVKALESKNLVVPVTGDFAGPKALRQIARYLTAHRATVGAFYVSNVEQYLYQDGKWRDFCRNVAALPLAPWSTFIRSTSGRGVGLGVGFVSSLGAMAAEVRDCE